MARLLPEEPLRLPGTCPIDDAARTAFEALPYSHRQRHVLAIEGAKTPETRARRIDKALSMLRQGR